MDRTQTMEQLNTASTTVESLRTLMNKTAAKFPEYPVVMKINGVGPSLGPQLMTEFGDVTRFTHKDAITAFAGVNLSVNESGSYEQKSVPPPSVVLLNLEKPCLRSWTVSAKQCHRMPLFICSWIRNMPQASHTMFT